jgi:hypothetical protein
MFSCWPVIDPIQTTQRYIDGDSDAQRKLVALILTVMISTTTIQRRQEHAVIGDVLVDAMAMAGRAHLEELSRILGDGVDQAAW